MKAVFTLSLLALLPVFVIAQCGSQRYIDPVFTSSRTHENLAYNTSPSLQGLCLIESNTNNQTYRLDVYEPDGDTALLRPCIVYAHGGAFLIGDRRMPPIEQYCYEMASRGYVVVSLDYRKCFNTLSNSSSIRAVYRALQDMKAAIRFVKAISESLRIDTSRIIAAGNSAGSIMAVQAAYADEENRAELPATYSSPDLGCPDCSGNLFSGSSFPNLLFNYWGAVYDTSWIQSGEAPVISFHGDNDFIVLPGKGSPFNFPIFPSLYGSVLIHQRALHQDIPSELYILPGEGHEPWLLSSSTSENFDFIVDKSAIFAHKHLLKPAPFYIDGPGSACQGYPETYTVAPNPGSTYCWEVSNGTLLNLNLSGTEAQILWEDGPYGTIAVTETNLLGASGSPQIKTVENQICCLPPEGLTELWITPSAAQLAWNESPGATAYRVTGRKQGGQTKSTNAFTNFKVVLGLKSTTTYEWSVRSVCDTAISEFAPIRTFSTPAFREAEPGSVNMLSQDEIAVFPNPSNGEFMLSTGPNSAKIMSISVFDITGRELPFSKEEIGYNAFRINLDGVQKGTYFIRIDSESGVQSSRLMIF